jgi:biotin carboxyl carrier protein
MTVRLIVDGKEHDISVDELDEGTYDVHVGDELFEVTVTHDEDGGVECTLDGSSYQIKREGRSLRVDDEPVDVAVGDLAQASLGAGAGASGELKPPMPGEIVEVLVEEGDEVTSGQTLIVLEAMKMQNDINAPGDAVVEEVLVAEGDSVGEEDTLVVLD